MAKVVTLRYWPNGRVTQSFEMTFPIVPAVGDVIEINDQAEFVVKERRFAKGRVYLYLGPTGNTLRWTTDELVDAWKAGLERQKGSKDG